MPGNERQVFTGRIALEYIYGNYNLEIKEKRKRKMNGEILLCLFFLLF